MLISLRADGTAVMLLPSHVYQGSNVANVFVTAPFPNTTVLQVGFTLPNGTTASAPMTYVQDPENNLVVWQYTIAAAITNEAGAASVSITATTTTGQVIASQSVPFTIEATTLPVLPDTPSQDEWTLVLQYIQQNSANIATLQGQVSSIEETANTANDNASEALSTAQSAEQTAQQAETTANGFATEIETANQNASEALETANQAASEVGQYTAQIEQANENASAAVQTANAAQATANAANQNVQDIIDGTTPAAKATADGDGNIIPDTYATNDYVNATFTPRSFFQNLYLSRTGALTANIVTTKPTAAAGNYMTTTTTNTTLDFGSATKLTLTRTLQSLLQVTPETAVKITLSFAPSRNAQVEFGARVLVDGTPISSNQAFGLNSYNGNASFTNVAEASFSITLDLITGVQEFNAGQLVTIEIFTRQVNNSSLTIQYFCGVSVSGVERNSFAGITTLTTILDTAQIADNAITTAKIADQAVTKEKLSSNVQATLDEVDNIVGGTTPAGKSNKVVVSNTQRSLPSDFEPNTVSYFYTNGKSLGLDEIGLGATFFAVTTIAARGTNYFVYQLATINDTNTVYGDLGRSFYRYGLGGTWYKWREIITVGASDRDYLYPVDFRGGLTSKGATVLAVDPTTLTPSTDNGWTEGTTSSVLPSAGVYWVSLDGLSPATVGVGLLPFNGNTGGTVLPSLGTGASFVVTATSSGFTVYIQGVSTPSEPSTVWFKKA